MRTEKKIFIKAASASNPNLLALRRLVNQQFPVQVSQLTQQQVRNNKAGSRAWTFACRSAVLRRAERFC